MPRNPSFPLSLFLAAVVGCGNSAGPGPVIGSDLVSRPRHVEPGGPKALQASDDAESKRPRIHRVERGETAFGIARDYQLTLAELVEANELEDPTRLSIGQELEIPEPGLKAEPKEEDEEETEESEEAPPKRAHPEVSKKRSPPSLSCAAHPAEDDSAEVSRSGFAWPVDGVVISGFGHREGVAHEGLDIAAPIGTPIRASAPGEVIFAGEQGAYGRLVIVRHADDRHSIYARNAANCVAEGARVEQGDLLGLVGDSGESDSPFVHFELREGSRNVNPRAHLPRAPRAGTSVEAAAGGVPKGRKRS